MTKLWQWAGCLLAGALLSGMVLAQDESIDTEDDAPDGVEELTRGPVHEAFANPVTGEVKPLELIAREPPAAIEEVPPEFKPDGDDVEWISGYWSWDEERHDFLWVSGVYRKTPPDQRWVAGYWDKVEGGWRWVSGFWSPEEETEVTYYDPPPATLEAGPTSESPSDEHFWSPGCWNYYTTGYRWRPGYWARSQPNWVWTPDRWSWTPSGAVFCRGYWDYDLAYRGSVFTPVYFRPGIYNQVGFTWRPRCAINPAALMVNFWIRPNHGHYYFGNYYGGNFNRWGYTPICHYYGRRGWGWDPIVAYNQCHYRRQGINYHHQLNDWHRHCENNPHNRPPSTWRDQVTIIKNQNITINNITNITNVNQVVKNGIAARPANRPDVMALPIKSMAKASAKNDNLALRIAQVDKQGQEQAIVRAREVRQISAQRAKLEAQAKAEPRAVRDPKIPQARTTLKIPAIEKVTRVDNKPGVDRPGRDDKPGVIDKPGRDDKPLVVDKPGRDDDAGRPQRPNAKDRPARPGVDKPVVDKPVVDKPVVDKPVVDKPVVVRPGVDKPVVKPSVDKPVIKPGVDRPVVNKPVVDNPKPKIVVDPPAIRDPKEPKVRPRPDPVVTPKPEPRIERPKPEPRVLPKPEPKVIPKPEPRVLPKPEPKVTRPEPRIERPAPRPEPKVIVKKPEPRVERPAPRPEPRIVPRPEPKPQVRPAPAPRPEPRVNPPPKVNVNKEKGKGNRDK